MQNAQLETNQFLEDSIRKFEKEKKINVYKGKPEKWNILGHSADESSKLKLQKEIKDVRILRQLYDQVDNIIQDKEEILNKKQREEMDYPIKTNYEK